jgi:DNA-binding transcriptional regulator YiaG
VTVRPPAHILPFFDVMGADLTIEFLLEFGGAELHLGANPRAEGRVVKLIGPQLARRLAESHLPRRVPTGKPWIAQVWKERGLSVAEIARRLHMTDVAVRRWLSQTSVERASADQDNRQLPLL